jgi:hypothetical protein
LFRELETMKLKFFLFALFALALGLVRPASADIVYSVNIDTGSIKDSLGGLDFTFAGGNPTPALGTVKILDFVTDGSGPQLSGSAGVSLDNSPGYNHYFTPTTYGNSISFKLSFSGVALTSPGISTFAFSLLDQHDKPVLVKLNNNPGRFAFTIDVGNDVVNDPVNNFMTTGTVNLVPEPDEYAMMLLGFGMVGWQIKRKQRKAEPAAA